MNIGLRRLFRRAGFDTIINQAFPDPESAKSREIDVVAEITRHVERIPIGISVQMKLIIECKNTMNPFVIIGESGQSESNPSDMAILSFDPLSEFNFPGKRPHETVYNELNVASLPGFRKSDEFIGHQLVRMNRQSGSWKADNGSIYDSILYPMAKAWHHSIEDTRAANNEDPNWDLPYLDYLIPVIVTSGPVIAVDASHDEPAVSEVGWASLRREFSSKDLPAYMHADVVGFDHLGDYLSWVRLFWGEPVTLRG